jgi:ubiquinone/menaquinone biosynthesis C-methylase UbiE
MGALDPYRITDNIPDGEFDAVVAHTLVSHVQEPLTMIKEAARVVKPSGLISIKDGDLRIDYVCLGRSCREQKV